MNDLLEIIRFFRVVNLSVEKVNEIKRGKVDGIKLHNCRAKGDVLLICIVQIMLCVVFLWAYMEFAEYDIPKLHLILGIWFVVNLFFTVIIGRAAFYYYKYADECYLTENGIVSIPVLYTREDCKFIYSKRYESGIKKCTVEVDMWQRGKIISSSFIVLEREDEAEEIVNKINEETGF